MIRYIHWRDDFSVTETFYQDDGSGRRAIPVPSCVEICYFTLEGHGRFVASRNGNVFRNCSLSANGYSLTVNISLRGFPIGHGRLLRIATVITEDASFPDGLKYTSFPGRLDVVLYDGKSDGPLDMASEVVFGSIARISWDEIEDRPSLDEMEARIMEYIRELLSVQLHSHSNKAVLDKLGESDGKPTYDGDPLMTETAAAGKFLRKDVSDRSAGRISADGGLEAGTFNPGLTGTGAFIDQYGAAEMKSLVLRSFLEVPELRYNRVSIEIGNKWNAPGGGIIEEVVIDRDQSGAPLPTGIITLHLEDGEIGTVAEDDICQGIFHDGLTLSNNATVNWDDGKGNFKFSGFVTSYFRITEVLDSQRKRFRYALRGTDASWPHMFHPVAAMHFVGYGNFTDTTRQVSRYSTRTYERFLKGVNTWEFSSSNIAAQFGDLSNLSVLGMTGMSGYSAYLNNIYMSGTIKQIEDMDLRLEIDTNGDNFLAWGESLQLTCKVWRGGYYDEVTDQITSWTITRDSADPVEDAAWLLKPKVRNFAGSIEICYNRQENDLGRNPDTTSTLFLITASLSSGDQAQAEIVI